jgi:hypothetical protein
MALILLRRKAGAVDIADVFSTDLYTGNGSTQSITNGIDLSGEGGLVWIKARNGGNQSHNLFDTERGTLDRLSTDNTFQSAPVANTLTAYNSNGFDLGSETATNFSGRLFASWTFLKSPNFFDVVTYTGDGTSGRSIAHNLGSVPGMIVVKRTDNADNWFVYHRSTTATDRLKLNSTDASGSATTYWNDTEPTDSVFTVGTANEVNASGGTYVAYLFAHDTTDNGVIQCGSYTGNGSSSGPTITLGWEPQWVMIKRATGGAGNWCVFDNQRGASTGNDALLIPNSSGAESSAEYIEFSSTGFQLKVAGAPLNGSSDEHIYIAIRKEGV